MHLHVLGCWAPYPRVESACPGYLIKDEECSILLDCGHGVMSRLGKHQDFRSLDCLILTHYHADHIADVWALRHAIAGSLREGGRTDKLKVFAPRYPENEAERLEKCSDAYNITWIEDLPSSGVFYCATVHNIQIMFKKVPHSLPAYAVSIAKFSKRLITYSGDLSYEEDMASFVLGSPILLCEASLKNKDSALANLGHLTAGQAGKMAREANVKTLMLTHFWPEYDPDDLRREAAVEFLGEIKLANVETSLQID